MPCMHAEMLYLRTSPPAIHMHAHHTHACVHTSPTPGSTHSVIKLPWNHSGGLLLLAAKGGGPFGDAGGFGKRGGKPDGSSGGSGTSGSGSSKAGRRGSKSGGAGKKPVALRSRDTPPPKDLTISPPLTVTLLEEGKTGLLPDPW